MKEYLLVRRPERAVRCGLQLFAFFSAALMMSAIGCGPPTQAYVARSTVAPPMKACFDELCDEFSKPVVLGGKDFSAPSIENIGRWQRAGLFAGEDYLAIQETYRRAGYVWNTDRLPCNCECLNSAHAALGGKCLDPPLPGTKLYEKVVWGGDL